MAEGDPRLALVYAAATQSIAQQLDTVNQLRSNAGTLLGAISIATAFLGGLHGRRPLAVWGTVAVVAFIIAVLAAVAILVPRTRWMFRLNSDTLLDGYINKGASLDIMHQQLARYLELGYQENKVRLNWMFYLFGFAAIAMTVEVIAWVIDLTRGP